jgi:hypothetical protein
LIKKLKDAKKKKKKQKKDATVSQRVTQKVIIGSNLKDKNDGNAGRSFPVVQFLPQQNMDTQLLRDLLLRSNSSPLTRDVVSRVPYKPSYDTSDQYGLTYNDNTFYSGSIPSMGQQYDNQTEISSLSEDAPELNSEYSSFFGNDSNLNNNFDTSSLLQPPPQKQGTLDTPMPTPKPNALAQSKITTFYQPEEPDLFSRETERIPDDDEFVRFNETPKKSRKSKKKKYLPEDATILSADTEIVTPIAKDKPKPRGRPKGSKNKPKDTSKEFTEK